MGVCLAGWQPDSQLPLPLSNLDCPLASIELPPQQSVAVM
jgi:hypothetical protein